MRFFRHGALVVGLALAVGACSQEMAEEKARLAAEKAQEAIKPIDDGATEQDVDAETVKRVQQQLTTLKEYMGPITGKLDQVTLVASPFLESLAEVAVAHRLLEAAVVAEGRLRADEDDLTHGDVEFYRGKVLAAKYFSSCLLPQTHARVKAIVGGDRSPLDIPDGGFASAR